MKKILCYVLIFVISGMVLPFGVYAEETTEHTDGYYTYIMSDGKVTITDVNTSISGDVTVPDTLGGYPVTSIGEDAFGWCTSLTSITIPDSVTSIGGSAFNYCTSLTSITIPDSVTSIGSCAFYNCKSLTSVTIPDSVTSIGGSAFSWCTSLTSITIPDSVTSIGSSAFYNTAHYNNVSNWENDVLYIGNHLIEAKTNIIGEYAVKSGTITIADDAFGWCTSLTSITIPDSVTSIGSSAFSGCTSLTSITIPDSFTSIGGSAFSGCTSLTSITIPDSVTSIGERAFVGCKSLTSITIPNSVTSIGDSAFFNCTSLTSIEVNDGNEYYCDIDGILFDKGVTKLILYPIKKTDTSYTIPDSVTSIDEYAFYDCTSLTSVSIVDSVTSIGGYAFCDCTSLTSITIPDSVTYIGTNSFSGTYYYNDESNWNNGALYIGKHLIDVNESSSEEYHILSGTLTIAEGAFFNCNNIISIKIPESVKNIYKGEFSSCDNLMQINVEDGNKIYCDIDGVLFDKNVSTLLQYPQGKTDSVYITPKSVTSIGHEAFYNCTNLTSITIPDSVTSIGNYAFYNCDSLTSITIPDSVTSIGNYAFYNCDSLTSITIPDNVTSIGNYAFYNTILQFITLPSSVVSIGEYAFGHDYVVALRVVYYRGTENDKANIIIADVNYDLHDAIWYYNSCIDSENHLYDDANDSNCNKCGYSRFEDSDEGTPGDTNGDGKINGKDYAMLLQSINGWSVTIDKAAADVTGDGKINGKDYALLLQYINGWNVELK